MHHRVVAKFTAVATKGLGAHDPIGGFAFGPNLAVTNRRADCEGEVGRQGPRRCGPGKQLHAIVEGEGNSQRRVLARPGCVVKTNLEVRERCFCAPRVWHDPIGAVDQTLVIELLEGPDDALHIGDVHRLVVVLKVDPAGLTGDVELPLSGIPLHRGTAVLVELVDAVFGDGSSARHPEFLFGPHLGGQTMAVPAKTTFDSVAAHGLVAGHDVLDITRQQMPVMGQAVGERWPVIEHILGVSWPLLDRGREGVFVLPLL